VPIPTDHDPSLSSSYYVILYYLPIYFQSVDGYSASHSGVNNIPLVLGVGKSPIFSSSFNPSLTRKALFSVIAGGLITTFGLYVMPFLLSGSAMTIIGAAWIYTLDIDSPSSHWISYQVIIGIGMGISVQIPIIANQALVDMSEISSVSAITLCKSFLHTLS